MKVLFWGTPDFALPTLRALWEEGHEIVGVVTQPDKPAGRGRAMRASPVKREAQSIGARVLQPERPRGVDFLAEIGSLEPQISVVAAYGHILVDDVLSLPPHGSVNVHASLLPELRGAAPVNWAIIRGHQRSGVTVMRMVRELDAGPVLYQIPIDILPGMTAGDLFSITAELGAEALIEALALLEAGALEAHEQDDGRATYAPKLSRDDARLDWNMTAAEIDPWVRGCDPWPAAWSTLDGNTVQLFEPLIEDPDGEPGSQTRGTSPAATPGEILEADPRSGILVATGRGALRLGVVKPAGRARMSAAAWVRGRGVAVGQHFD
jgi:methionyl-tRNA formyltransferase